LLRGTGRKGRHCRKRVQGIKKRKQPSSLEHSPLTNRPTPHPPQRNRSNTFKGGRVAAGGSCFLFRLRLSKWKSGTSRENTPRPDRKNSSRKRICFVPGEKAEGRLTWAVEKKKIAPKSEKETSSDVCCKKKRPGRIAPIVHIVREGDETPLRSRKKKRKKNEGHFPLKLFHPRKGKAGKRRKAPSKGHADGTRERN